MASLLVAVVLLGCYHHQQTNPEIATTGQVKVHDGDTITLNGQKIRLQGIDAPELNQTCQLLNKDWPCGEAAKQKLQELVANNPVNCTDDGKDKYNRQLAICFVNGQDINKYMVKSGYAVAYRKYMQKYVDDEDYAKEHKLGIWSGLFQTPEHFRHHRAVKSR